jgi:hypothetical protein
MNTLTLPELKELIASRTDEVDILEILNINSYELVEAFSDRIEDKFEELVELYDE